MQASQGVCDSKRALVQVSTGALLNEASCDATPKRGFLRHAQGARPDICSVSSILALNEHQQESRLTTAFVLSDKDSS
jgi:hypothetical protein